MCARAGTASRGGEGGGIGGGDPRHAGRHVHADVADLDALPAHTYFYTAYLGGCKSISESVTSDDNSSPANPSLLI